MTNVGKKNQNIMGIRVLRFLENYFQKYVTNVQ